jgi:hypothetical protein
VRERLIRAADHDSALLGIELPDRSAQLGLGTVVLVSSLVGGEGGEALFHGINHGLYGGAVLLELVDHATESTLVVGTDTIEDVGRRRRASCLKCAQPYLELLSLPE